MTSQETWKHYQQHPISHTTAHYLMAVHDLKSENGYARLTDLANRLDISPGSCHTTLQTLKKRRFVVEDDNKFLTLTPKGEKVVENIEKNDKLLMNFFHDVLGLNHEQSEIDACKMEHLLGLNTSNKLDIFLNFVKEDSKIVKDFMKELSKRLEVEND